MALSPVLLVCAGCGDPLCLTAKFAEKLRDIAGLYLDPPKKALVISVDEKSQIQALERTRPLLPLRPGIPARQTHDFRRHGTTTLFAALSMLDGKVIGECMPRHRSEEFIRFLRTIDCQTPAELDLHLIVDNYSTHKSPPVKRWLGRHKRFHLHFTPTGSSWLNMVERWFGTISQKRIRRGSFESVKELVAAIEEYLDQYNRVPKKFVWTKDADMILAKVERCKAAKQRYLHDTSGHGGCSCISRVSQSCSDTGGNADLHATFSLLR